MKTLLNVLCISFLSFLTLWTQAQAPANDNCANATPIAIGGGGYALGTFRSDTLDMTSSTAQVGENFYSTIYNAGETAKTIWYKFTINTARECRIQVKQPSSVILAGNVGFTVYKSSNCFPVSIDADNSGFNSQSTWGISNPICVKPGEYLVQVCGTNIANGPVYIELELFAPSSVYPQIDTVYDYPSDAFDFGVLPACNNYVDFTTGCQTVTNASESCPALGANYLDYTQSVWFTFTTPAYLDWLGVYVGPSYGNGYSFLNNPLGTIIGYNLYKGDAKVTPIGSLVLVDGCVTDTFTTYNDLMGKGYECQLLTNTTYSVQVFFHKDFQDDVRVWVQTLGVAPASATKPLTASVAASNKLSVLPAGSTTSTDYWGCNSRLSVNACGQTNPAAGVYSSLNNLTYTLNDWYTFELSQSSNVDFSVYSVPFSNLLVRIFNKDINASCANIDTATNLYAQFIYSNTLRCMPAGKYSMQILGKDDYLPQYYSSCYSKDNLGQAINLTINVTPVQSYNNYSLVTNGAVDTVNRIGNSYGALKQDTLYTTHTDTFGCENTVRPAGTHCNDPVTTKAMYFQFRVGDANSNGQVDSGIVYLQGNFSWNYWYGNNVLYKGDANSLANAQNSHLYPDSITGLSYATPCVGNNSWCTETRACVTPGMYTLVTYGDSSLVSQSVSYNIQEKLITTTHRSAALAEDMGNIIDTIALYGGASVTSQTDYFSCIDNPATIGGNAPCIISNNTPSTKLIYRQFYLSAPALVTITNNWYNNCSNTGVLSLFSGKATNGIGTLTPLGGSWDCFSSNYTGPCTPLAAGWYTVVAYGEGPTYANPTLNYAGALGNGGHIGLPNYITISVTQAPPGPVYNRPYKACVDSVTNLPFVIKPATNSGTAAYPMTDTTYTLYTEYYNCTTDTPFASHPVVECNSSYQPNRVTYYVFRLTQMAYIHIAGLGGSMAKVYPFNVKVDSALMTSTNPVQPCINNGDLIELCRLQPGTYTLVIFPPDYYAGSSITPTIYVENVGYSRFDHAVNAYDFGLMPMDSAWYSGKPGDVNPLNAGRAASNDFFYCTTGAQIDDPTSSACYVQYDPYIYSSVNNIYAYDDVTNPASYAPRRNLWYTFVLDKGGNCRVRINNKTPNKSSQYNAAIYKSDVNGSLPFTTLVSSGQVDSTLTQGLTYQTGNVVSWCYAYNEMTFYRDPCTAVKERYYIVVDNYYSLEPNSQVEVEILYDTINAIQPKYDFYSNANVINGLNQTAPPYTNVVLGPGVYSGATDNFTCATYSPPSDVLACGVGDKTLWYTFKVAQTGVLRIQYLIDGAYIQPSSCEATLLKEIIPGDSTATGLSYIGRTDPDYSDPNTGLYWNSRCITPGTYYLMFSGYTRITENVQPIIWLENQEGDYCTDPVSGTISAAGSINMNAVVDCHTIGEGFGEDGSNMGCLVPAGNTVNQYKSTWFRFDVTGPDTFDITTSITRLPIGASGSQIRYRVMYGNCGAMNTGYCSVLATTTNRLDCMVAGSYFIQVVEPINTSDTMTLTVDAVQSPPGCTPLNTCYVVPNYTSTSACSTDSVYFINQSTSGDSIKYVWNFGFGGLTDTVRNPVVKFPAPLLTQNYSVLLVVTNTSCNKTDSVRHIVTVKKKPYLNLGNDTTICSPNTLVLRATSEPGTSYLWQDGSTDSIYTVTYTGQYSVADTFNGCTVYDTIDVTVNTQPVADLGPDVTLCAGQTFSGNVYQGIGETYLWSNGATTYNFDTANAGTYWVRVNVGDCVANDTIVVSSVSTVQPLGNDTTICNGIPVILDATTIGASSYSWDDGSANPSRVVNSAGIYWVDIAINSCSLRDSITVSSPVPIVPLITGNTSFCVGGNTTLTASGGTGYIWSTAATTTTITVNSPNTYTVTITDLNGCSAADSVVVMQNAVSASVAPAALTLTCTTPSTVLIASGGVSYNWGGGITTANNTVSIPNTYIVTVTDINGCTATASSVINQDTVAPVASVTPSSFNLTCSISSALLAASGGGIYDWGAGITTATNTVNTPGIYTVSVTATNGCTATATSVVSQDVTPPIASVTPASFDLSCSNPSTTLIATGGVTYDWGGGITSDTNVVSNPNTYTVTVTGVNGCSATATAIVTQSNIPPVVTINPPGAVLTCTALSVTLTASGGVTYNWGGGIITDTTTVVSANTYSVTVTDASGCTASASVVVGQNIAPPVAAITPSSAALTCTTISAILTASGGVYYDWGGGVTTVSNVVSSANTYTVSVTGANGCTATASSIVTLDTIAPVATIAPANATLTCTSPSTTLTASGGGNYDWGGGITTALNTVSNSGTYTVTVTATNGCTASASSVINQTITVPPAAVSPTSFTLDCNIASTTLTASGGVSYDWGGGITTAGNTVNLPSSYTVTVTDANGCTASAMAVVTQDVTPPAAIVSPTNATLDCITFSTMLTAGGGGTYDWGGGIATASITISSPNSYTVTVTGANGCTASASAIVIQDITPPVASITPAFPALTCTTLSATLTATGGVSYDWGGGVTAISNVVSSANTYTVSVTGANGCTATASSTVIVDTIAPIASVTPINATLTCLNSSATLTASGGGSYDWGAGLATANNTVNLANTYTVTVTDNANGCTATASSVVTQNVTQPNVSIAPGGALTCSILSSTLTASSSTINATYNWGAGITTSSNSVSLPGTYTVTVTDPANGCTVSSSEIVTQNISSPNITLSNSGTINCLNSNVTITASSITPNVSYNWGGGNTSITNVVTAAGTYFITVTDPANNCTATASNAVQQDLNTPVVSIAAPAVLNCINATVTLSATSTATNATYNWGGGITTFTNTVSLPSSYSVTVTDAVNGCSSSASVNVSQDVTNPTVSISPPTIIACNNLSVILSASSSALSTSYDWGNGNTSSTYSVSAAGTYTVSVTDNGNGCTATASTDVTAVPLMNLSEIHTNVSCNGGNDGAIDVTVVGGQTPYSFLWSNTSVTEDISSIPVGNYSVIVTDSMNCSVSISVTISEPASILITVAHVDVSCNGANNGSIDVSVSGGMPAYTYFWNDANTNEDRGSLPPGTYSVTVTDSRTCSASISTMIAEPNPLVLQVGVDHPTCLTNPADGHIDIDVSGGTAPYVYFWSNGADTSALYNLSPGLYSISVSDTNNCTEDTSLVLVYQYDFSVSATPSVTINLGENTTLGFTITGTPGNYVSMWSPGASLSCVDCVQPFASPVSTTLYQVQITNNQGCIATDTVTVYVKPDYSIFVPNAFTPNGDGLDDYFEVFGVGNELAYLEIKVFNKWGEKVYESNDHHFKWDGTYKGVMQNPAVFVWQLKMTFINGYKDELRTGSVTLIR